MELTNSEMAGIALFILFIVYMYYTPRTIYKTQPIYYPVRIPRRHRPRHKPRFIPGVPNPIQPIQPIQPIPQSTLPFQQMKCDKDKDGNFINCK